MALVNEIKRISSLMHIFEDKALQSRALSTMPYKKLSNEANKKLDILNKKDIENNITFQDLMLVEMLNWFKEDFFSWYDAGVCPNCNKKVPYCGMALPTTAEIQNGGDRVEYYVCQTCDYSTRFPRYFNPRMLLMTRRGRCMEYGSCFMLFVKAALQADVRYVIDKTDHVWVEVFSNSLDRWLHVDPCENRIDTPLLYEKGWNKKFHFVYAFSIYEVVNVVWRYTTDYDAVIERRKEFLENCTTEEELARLTHQVSVNLQKGLSEEEKLNLQLRRIMEFVEFFAVKKEVKEGENDGRVSGSLEWRLSRGESGQQSSSSYIFYLLPEEIERKCFILQYNPCCDLYRRSSSKNSLTYKGFKDVAFMCQNMQRKHEKDWKMVYLARIENSEPEDGKISWKIDWSEMDLKFDAALVILQHKTFNRGKVIWSISSSNKNISGGPNGALEVKSEDFDSPVKQLEITAILECGVGISWQHNQLFRSPDDSKLWPFFVRVSFK